MRLGIDRHVSGWAQPALRAAVLGALVVGLFPALPHGPGAPAATPTAEAGDLEWTNSRPPMTDAGDGNVADGVKHLPDFGAVVHPMAVAPNGDLFVAGGGADVNGSGGGTCANATDANDPNSNAATCDTISSTRPALYKSTDGGNSFSATYLGSLVGAGGTSGASAFIRKVVVSPNYPTDPFVAVAFTAQSFTVGTSSGVANTNVNGIAWSTNSGLSWATTLTGANGAPFNSIDVLSIALSADFDWTNAAGTVAIGGQWEAGAGSCVLGAACATTVYQASVSALKVTPTGASFLGITDASSPAAVTLATLDVSYTFSTPPVALARVYRDATKTYGQVRGGTGFALGFTSDEILDNGTTSFSASYARVAFKDTYASGGSFFVSASNAAGTLGGVFRYNGTNWEEKTPSTGTCSGGVTDISVAGNASTTKVVAAFITSNQVCRTTNEGSTWASADADGGTLMCEQCRMTTTSAVPTVANNRVTPNTAYWATSTTTTATTAGGGVTVSTDFGASWRDTGLTNEPFIVSNVRQVNATTAFANASSTAGRAVFFTTNYGAAATWRRSLRYGGTDLQFIGAGGNFTNDNTAYAYRSAATTANLLKTTDGGLTWRKTNLDPYLNGVNANELITSIATRGGSVVYVGGNAGHVDFSTDGGTTWTELSTDLGDGIDEFDFIDTARTRYLITAQGSDNLRKVWMTTDSGTTFTQVGDAATAWGAGNPTTTAFNVFVDGVSNAGQGVITVVAGGAVANPDIYRFDTRVNGAAWVSAGTATEWDFAVAQPTASVGDGVVLTVFDNDVAQGLYRTFYPWTVTASTWPALRLPTQAPPVFNANSIVLEGVAASGNTLIVTSGGRVQDYTLTSGFMAPLALTSPVNGAPVLTNTGTSGQPVVLRWAALAGAACYDLQVSVDANFSSLLLNTTSTAMGASDCGVNAAISTGNALNLTSGILAVTEGTTYQWRVRVRATTASAAAGLFNPGPWSANGSFAVVSSTTALVSLGNTSGIPGSTVTVNGTFFSPLETVVIAWDNPAVTLVAPSASASGEVSATVTIPANAPIGVHVLKATGGSSSKQASAQFTVTAPPSGAYTFKATFKLGVPGGVAATPANGYHVDVTAFTAGTSTVMATGAAHVDSGSFQILLDGLAAGNYDVQIKGTQTLARKMLAVALPQISNAAALDFGTLRTGDLNGDNAILGADYSALVSNYGVTESDLASVSSNSQAQTQGIAGSPVRFALRTAEPDASDRLRVDVVMQPGSQRVDAADVLLRFDPSALRLVDASGAPATTVAATGGMPVVLANQVDAAVGTVLFSAGRSPVGTSLDGPVTLCTLTFEPLTALPDTLPVTLDLTGAGHTTAYYRGAVLVVE